MEYSKSDIRKFHNYELSEDKLDQFEKQIKNESMNETFENFKMSEQLSAELYSPGYLDLVKAKKDTFLKELPHVKNRNNLFSLNRYVIGIAASICVLIVSVIVFTLQEVSPSSINDMIGQSAMASLNLDHLGTTERGDDVATKNPIIDLYESGKYAQVIEDVSSDESSKMLQLLEARSFMHLGDNEEAVNLLQGLNTIDFPQRDALLWSLVEAELSMQNRGNAEIYLKEIIRNKYPNYNQAENILTNF